MDGLQDVEIGYPEFDERFIMKGNDDSKLRQLFANSQIRQLIGEQSYHAGYSCLARDHA